MLAGIVAVQLLGSLGEPFEQLLDLELVHRSVRERRG
jgi:hypothetical protein